MISLDASALASLFVRDVHSAAIRAFLRTERPEVGVSTFAAAEFASAVGLRVRAAKLRPNQGHRTLALFDAWAASQARLLDVEPEDHRVAASFVRRFDLGLRAPDALHIAACRRLGLTLLTVDRRQAAAAAALGVACSPAGVGPAGRPA